MIREEFPFFSPDETIYDPFVMGFSYFSLFYELDHGLECVNRGNCGEIKPEIWKLLPFLHGSICISALLYEPDRMTSKSTQSSWFMCLSNDRMIQTPKYPTILT